MGENSGKVCLITGVGPGTGRALAEQFALEGYSVAMLARNGGRLDEIAQATPGTHPFVCDVSKPDTLREVLGQVQATLGIPDVVVHNAVGGAFGDVLSIEPEVLERNFQINVMALLQRSPSPPAVGRNAKPRRVVQPPRPTKVRNCGRSM